MADFKGITHVVEISSVIGKSCEHCSEAIGGGYADDQSIDKSINHYIQEHGYKLLHIGSETTRDDKGRPYDTTVAVLGIAKPPAKAVRGKIAARRRVSPLKT